MNVKNKKTYYLLYSLFFMILSGSILFFYYSQGKTMIDSGGDGFRQHYRALIYYSDYLKSIFQNFLHGHFNIPHWDFAVSEGSDIITTFHYYGLGDIFTILCFLFLRSKMYLYYDFATFARLFATGVAFSELCFYKKKQNYWMVLTCSLIYAFCPFSFSNLNSHVFFISAAVFLPLIILGVEKVLNDDKPYVLIVSVMLSALSNIYFFYMNVLSTIIFTFVRLLFIEIVPRAPVVESPRAFPFRS